MAGMTQEEIQKARDLMEAIPTPSVAAKEIQGSGVLITTYTGDGSIIVSKEPGADVFDVAENTKYGNFHYSMPEITAAYLPGSVESTESQAEMVIALISKGITFPLMTAETY